MTTFYKCDVPEEFRNSKHYRRTIEDDRRDSAEARTQLWHYTNVEALFKIISNQTIRFSRIDCVNDLMEKEPLMIDNMYLGTYIACFNHNNKESIPLWNMYTSKGSGVRIEFVFKENKIQKSFIGFNNSMDTNFYKNFQFSDFVTYIHDVEYSDEYQILPIHKEDDNILVNTQAIAFEKNEVWSYEDETRIMMFTAKHINEDMPRYIDFNLDFNKVRSIKIVFDPWMSEEIKQSVKLTTQYYMKDKADILHYDNSELEGKIR